nr:hypothetical protein [uncultured Haemophilus sp.]
MKDYIITDLSLLDGTCYFELLAGEYKDKCWNEGSVFVEESYWSDFFDSVIAKYVLNYDYYDFIYVSKTECALIADELDRLSSTVSQARDLEELQKVTNLYYFKEEFILDFEMEKRILSESYSFTSKWFNEQSHLNGASILGM